MRAGIAAAGVVSVLAFGLGASAASAFYGNGAEIASASDARQEQADDASLSADISDDGRFVAMDTRASNFFADDDPDPPGGFRSGGIFRRDMTTGALDLVADGDVHDASNPDTVTLQGAHNPSISADGRFVAFSTAQKLTPLDTNDAVDVYVRDMNVAVRAPGAFALVSARTGADVPASYAASASPRPGRNPGSDVWPGSAISADGGKVVFTTVEVNSDLPGSATVDTPPYQVFVRDLAAKTTTLVTRTSADHTQPAAGAAGPAGISADGTAVAWTGSNAPAQTHFLSGEIQPSFLNFYLWQRIADGPAAPTRRLTGPADVDDPACPPGAQVQPVETATGPCYGPLTGPEAQKSDISSQLPALSADGYKVAFLVSTGPRPNDQTGNGLDAWITDMHPGVSRKAGSRELTREGAANDSRSTPSIDALTLSADGRRLALVTSRTAFVLPGLDPIGTFRRSANASDVALVDFDTNTIERVTRGYDGSDTNGGALPSVSASGNGDAIAFVSGATNMFFGDANERPDVFVARRTPEPVAPAPPPPITPTPPVVTDETPPDPPSITVRARRMNDGSVRVTVHVPGSGKVAATATARPKLGKSKKRPPLRTVAKKAARAGKAGNVVVPLRLASRYRALLRQGKLAARVKVVFSPSGGAKTLTRSISVAFALQKKSKK